MKKAEIISFIKEILRSDAAFCREKFPTERAAGLLGDPSVSEDLTDEDFVFAVNSYLCAFRVPGHLRFYKRGSGGKGAGVRIERFADALLVTAAAEESGFKKGDRIIALDDECIEKIAEKFREFFYGEPPERQGMYFEEILSRFQSAKILRGNGMPLKIPLQKNLEIPRRSPYCFEVLKNEISYLRLDDFESDSAVEKILKDHQDEIYAHEVLIIDIRENHGGSDTSFLPLLPLCVDGDEEFVFPSDNMEVNFSARNVDLRLSTLQEYMAASSEEMKPYFERAIRTLKMRRGMVFLPVEEEPIPKIFGTRRPGKVFVLIGQRCASSGEAFALAVKGLKKVTLVGSPTMGILRYSNCAAAMMGEYILVYPTSVSQGACRAEPDVELKRSENLSHDFEIEWVLQRIQGQG